MEVCALWSRFWCSRVRCDDGLGFLSRDEGEGIFPLKTGVPDL